MVGTTNGGRSKDIQFGKVITEAQFDEITKAAGEVKKYRQ
jgi:hypothetical protein